MKQSGCHRGMNLDKSLRLACEWGWKVTPVRRTGEVDVITPDGVRLRLNGRRKDTPRTLITLLRRRDPNRRAEDMPSPAGDLGDACEKPSRPSLNCLSV